MTLLGKNDEADASDGSSYLDLVSLIRQYGAAPKKDLEELWKRIVLNMAVSNTDDHLRNHGFILTNEGWILSPLYDVNPDVYAVATGSASPLILKGVAESGTGRWVTVNVPTLSFYEYCKLKGVEVINSNELMSVSNINKLDEKSFNRLMNHLSNLPKEFNKYVTIGGFPELVLSNDELYAQRILREDIVDKVLKRDLPELYNIRNISMLEKVFLYLCFNSSNIINYSNICQVLEKTSLVTVQEYIRYLESANLIYINEPVAVNGKNVLKSKPKIYIVDAAIRNAVLMNEDVIANATEMGYVVETAVYRQVNSYYGSTSHVGYYREKNNEDREIDIVVKGIRSDKYIEVKYREKSDIDSKNPLYSLPKQDDEIYVITKREMDYSVSICENGNKIVRIPAYAYLYLLGKEEYETV